jgi:hypothetical protein
MKDFAFFLPNKDGDVMRKAALKQEEETVDACSRSHLGS